MPARTFEDVGFKEWWEVLPAGHHSISGTVKIKERLRSPELGQERAVWLRLPSSYFHTAKRYPLIVMHDARDLFDTSTGYGGQEWGVDETLLRLEPHLEVIVAGVENAGNGRSRAREFLPWKSGSLAPRYLAFLTDRVIPLVRRACSRRIERGAEHTLIMGSSYGAVLSIYAFFERPDVFGLCGAIWTWPHDR